MWTKFYKPYVAQLFDTDVLAWTRANINNWKYTMSLRQDLNSLLSEHWTEWWACSTYYDKKKSIRKKQRRFLSEGIAPTVCLKVHRFKSSHGLRIVSEHYWLWKRRQNLLFIRFLHASQKITKKTNENLVLKPQF